MTPRALLPHILLAPGLMLLHGCFGDIGKGDDTDEPDVDIDIDTDTDSDSDTDTDADTDSDTDTDLDLVDVPISLYRDDVGTLTEHDITVELAGDATIDGDSISGSTAYLVLGEEGVVCDGAVEFEGSAYTGDCDGCDFAFNVTGEVVGDDTIPDCDDNYFYILPQLWRNSYYGSQTRLSYWSSYEPREYYYYYDYAEYDGDGDSDYGFAAAAEDLLYEVFGYSPTSSYYGRSVEIISHRDDPNSSFVHSGPALSWNKFFEATGTETHYYNYSDDECGYGWGYSEARRSYLQDSNDINSLPCDAAYYYYGGVDVEDADAEDAPETGVSPPPDDEEWLGRRIDVWNVELTAGQVFYITVDTVDPDTSFNPSFWVNGPDTCITARAWDNFRCTHVPFWGECPSGRFEAEEDGTYQVVVSADGACASDEAAYVIDVRTDPS